MTKEEIKAAVLEECDRLCSVKGRIVRIDPEYSQHYIRMDDDGDYCLRMDGVKCYVGPSVEDESLNWLAAYRLLGLEGKAKDAEIQRLRVALEFASAEISELEEKCEIGSSGAAAIRVRKVLSAIENALKVGTND